MLKTRLSLLAVLGALLMLFVLSSTWSITTATASTQGDRVTRGDSRVVTPTATRPSRLAQMTGPRQGPTVTPGQAGGHRSVETAQPMRPNDSPWTAIANYPQAIMDNSADTFNGKAYSVGGYNGSDTINNAYVYNPGSGTWAAIASMADAREKPEAAFVNGKLYVVGGWDIYGYPDANLEIYNPASNSWSTGASIPFALAAGVGVSANGKFYVIGGCDNGDCGYDYAYRYDPSSDTWLSMAAYPEYTSWQACGSINGLIYCAGGVAAEESQHTYVYDPDTDIWTPLADLPQTQWGMGYAAANGKLYISDGAHSETSTRVGYVYDPTSNSWSSIANSINTVYRGGSACGLYKIGGSTGGFSPVTNSEVFPGLTGCGSSNSISMTDVTIDGPTSGVAHSDYDFSGMVNPITATQPITYFWEASEQTAVTHTGGGLIDSVTFNWIDSGLHFITVTASNRMGTVTSSHQLIIPFLVYLPLVLKSEPAIVPTPTPTPTVTPTPRSGTPTPTPTATPIGVVVPQDGSWSGQGIQFSVTSGGTQISSMTLIMSGCGGGVTYYTSNGVNFNFSCSPNSGILDFTFQYCVVHYDQNRI